MNDELDKKLCEKYPKIFINRNASMVESCMHWGLECGDGWYDTIDLTCASVSATYETSVSLTKQQAKELGVTPIKGKNAKPLWWWPSDRRPRQIIGGKFKKLSPHKPNLREMLTYPPKFAWRKVKHFLFPTWTIYSLQIDPPQVVADQVKEKYGTLRFYYHLEYENRFRELAYGTDAIPEATKIAEAYNSYIGGIIHMAEVLSDRTCEVTGKTGEMHVSGGWYRALNREYAQSIKDRKWIAVADLPKED